VKILFITSTRIGDAILSTGLLAWLIERHQAALAGNLVALRRHPLGPGGRPAPLCHCLGAERP
jgi:ADP-heptose:LPS heptosyltransferase